MKKIQLGKATQRQRDKRDDCALLIRRARKSFHMPGDWRAILAGAIMYAKESREDCLQSERRARNPERKAMYGGLARWHDSILVAIAGAQSQQPQGG